MEYRGSTRKWESRDTGKIFLELHICLIIKYFCLGEHQESEHSSNKWPKKRLKTGKVFKQQKHVEQIEVFTEFTYVNYPFKLELSKNTKWKTQ
jgi:putative lipase involved disintegration of autophagic bodies